MAHARPFETSTLQDLSNDIKNTRMEEDLTPEIELRVSGVSGDFNFPLLGVWTSPSHLSQSGVATIFEGAKVIC
jgi:hypothetical protein